MRKDLLAGLAAVLLLASAGQVSAQVVQSQRMESEAEASSEPGITTTSPAVATTVDSAFYETRPEGDPIVRENDLFTMEFSTGVVFRATCQHIDDFDPCLQLPGLLSELDVASSLADRTKELLREMLDSREIIERLEQLTVEKIREEARKQSGISGPAAGHLLLGATLFAGGGVLSASRNEWIIDEGYIGVAIASVGLGLMLRPLIAKWRSSRVNLSRTGLAIEW